MLGLRGHGADARADWRLPDDLAQNSEASAGAVAAAPGLPPGVPRQRGADRRVDLARDPCLRRNRTGGLPLSGRLAALPGRRIRADRPVITIAYVLGRRQAGRGGRRFDRLRGLPLPLDGTGRHHAGHRRVLLWIRPALSSGPDRDVRTVVALPQVLRRSMLDIRAAGHRDRGHGLRPLDRIGAVEIRREPTHGTRSSSRMPEGWPGSSPGHWGR